jgi:hypothetical protein
MGMLLRRHYKNNVEQQETTKEQKEVKKQSVSKTKNNKASDKE